MNHSANPTSDSKRWQTRAELAAFWRDLEERFEVLSQICWKIDGLFKSSR